MSTTQNTHQFVGGGQPNPPSSSGSGSGASGTGSTVDMSGGGANGSSGDDMSGLLPNGADNPLAGLLAGSDTIIPDTQHLGTVGTLDPTLAQIENDANGVLANLGDLGVNPDTVTDIVPNDVVPNDSGVVADGTGLVGQVVSDGQGLLNDGTGLVGQVVNDAQGLLNDATGDTGAGNVAGDLANGAIPAAAGDIVSDASDALSDNGGNVLGDLGNGSIVDASALPGGAEGSSPLIDANVDPSQGSSIDAVSAGNGASGNTIDADTLPSSVGDILDAGALASPQTGDGGINATAGNGTPLLSADALTGTLPDASDVTNGSLNGTVNDLLNGSSSTNLVDAGAGAQDDGNAADASVLTPSQSGDDALNAFAGNGPTIATASALTGDQLQIPTLNGTGADSLVGSLSNEIAPATSATAPVETSPQLNDLADVSTPAGNVDASQILSNVAGTAQQATQHALI